MKKSNYRPVCIHLCISGFLHYFYTVKPAARMLTSLINTLLTALNPELRLPSEGRRPDLCLVTLGLTLEFSVLHHHGNCCTSSVGSSQLIIKSLKNAFDS